ncbi:MAG TPA: hypothetical protein PLB49_10715 [Chitinophagaceae bacterium]|nr:hypothetical protein [Chitinophagaceae bacterium]
MDSQTEKKPTALENISKLLPLLAVVLIFYGVSAEMLYYAFFDIQIQYYLEPSEIFLLFFDNIISTSFLIIVGVIILLYNNVLDTRLRKLKKVVENIPELKKKLDENSEVTDMDEDEYNIDKLNSRTNMYLNLFAGLFVISYLTKTILVFGYHNEKLGFVFLIISTFSVVIFILGKVVHHLTFHLRVSGRFLSFNNNTSHSFIVYLITALLILPFLTKVVEAISIRDYNRYQDAELILKDSTIITSTDSSYYIGKTQKYVFYYNRNKDQTTIYPMDEVKSVKVKFPK